MKVVVTGGNGYIGKHVVKRLLDKSYEVVVVDKNNTGIDSRAIFLNIDIFEDNENIFEMLGKPDICIHMAWRDGFVHESLKHIDDLAAHYRFLAKMVDAGISKIAVMGTMHEIGYWEGAIDADTPTNPKTLYGIAKDTLRRLMFKKTQGTNTKLYWMRGYYIMGDDINNHSVFTKILEAEERGDKFFPFTSGTNKFDFIKVDDLAKQIVTAISQDKYLGIIECCTGVAMSLGECMEKFIAENRLKIALKYNAFPNRIGESPIVYGDAIKINKIMREFGDEK